MRVNTLNLFERNPVVSSHYCICKTGRNYLALSTLGKIFSRRQFELFSYFSKKTDFDISCKLSPVVATIFINLSSANFSRLNWEECGILSMLFSRSICFIS